MMMAKKSMALAAPSAEEPIAAAEEAVDASAHSDL